MQGEIRKIARVKRKNIWRRSMVPMTMLLMTLSTMMMLSTNIALPIFNSTLSATALATQQVAMAMAKQKRRQKKNRCWPTINQPINQLQQAVTSATTGRLEAAPVNKNNQPAEGVVRLATTVYISDGDERARSAGWCNRMHVHHGDGSWASSLPWRGG